MKNPKITSGAFITCLALLLYSGICRANMGNGDAIDSVQGGFIEYSGSIGPYPVSFTFMNLHMGNGEDFYYQYETMKVNNGQPIQLEYQHDNGAYSVYYEYINGKHTGTFTIIRTKTKITGKFRNSKGKTFKVRAKMVNTNWADE